MPGEPNRTRAIVYLVMGVLIVAIEGFVLAVFVTTGEAAKSPLLRGVFPAVILAYGLYLAVTSARKLRSVGK